MRIQTQTWRNITHKKGKNVDQGAEFLTRVSGKHKIWHFNTLHLVVVLNTTSYFKTFHSQYVSLIAHQAVLLATVRSLRTPAPSFSRV